MGGDSPKLTVSAKDSRTWLQWIVYVFALLVVLAIIGTVGFSRVGLGQHSFNQVVYGWSYGLWLAFFLFRFVWRPLSSHLSLLLDP